MSESVVPLLEALVVLGAGAWVGGFATVTVVSASSRRSLDAPGRVSLFRHFGRRYAAVAAVAMLLMIVAQSLLVATASTPLRFATLIVAFAVTVIGVLGVLQARRMSSLRHAALENADPGQAAVLGRKAALAAALRILIGLGSAVLVVLALIQAGVS